MAKGSLKSIRELAAVVGKSHVAVSRWVKRDDWTFGPGPWAASQVAAIKRWAANTLAENPADGGASDQPKSLKDLPLTKQIDASVKLARKARLDFDLKIDKGEYHLVADCRRQRLRQIHEMKSAFLNMPDGLPIDADVKTMIKGRVLEILRKWSSPGTASDTPDPHEPVPISIGS